MNYLGTITVVNIISKELKSARTLEFLIKQVDPDFEDTVNNEHIYSIESVKDGFADENKPAIKFKRDIKAIIDICHKNDAGYFKVIK